MGVSFQGVKPEWRARLLAARAELPPDRLARAAAAVTGHVVGRLSGAARVGAYVPIGTEPGSLALLDALREGGTEVLLPVVGADGLSWGRYTGSAGLVPARWGLREPAGPAVALAGADAVLVPALAVDRRGVRLGRGGGHYDRALPAAAGAVLVALLHDGELVDRLPADPWDARVTAVVTPSTGWTELPVVEHHGS